MLRMERFHIVIHDVNCIPLTIHDGAVLSDDSHFNIQLYDDPMQHYGIYSHDDPAVREQFGIMIWDGMADRTRLVVEGFLNTFDINGHIDFIIDAVAVDTKSFVNADITNQLEFLFGMSSSGSTQIVHSLEYDASIGSIQVFASMVADIYAACAKAISSTLSTEELSAVSSCNGFTNIAPLDIQCDTISARLTSLSNSTSYMDLVWSGRLFVTVLTKSRYDAFLKVVGSEQMLLDSSIGEIVYELGTESFSAIVARLSVIADWSESYMEDLSNMSIAEMVYTEVE